MLPRQGSGTSSRFNSRRPSTPNRSVTGHGLPKLISVEWMRLFSADLCLTRCNRKRASSRSSRTLRIGQPDRRHQVAVTEHRKNLRVDLVGLARQRRETLDLLGVGDLDRPALLLEGVVDDPRAGHRLDHRAHRLAVDLLDSASERFSASRRRAVRRAGPDALPDRRAGKRRASFGLDRVQRATLERGLLGARFSGHDKRVTAGGPSSWQSKADAGTATRYGVRAACATSRRACGTPCVGGTRRCSG